MSGEKPWSNYTKMGEPQQVVSPEIKQEECAKTRSNSINVLPSRELTYPTLGKGKSSSKVIFDGIC